MADSGWRCLGRKAQTGIPFYFSLGLKEATAACTSTPVPVHGMPFLRNLKCLGSNALIPFPRRAVPLPPLEEGVPSSPREDAPGNEECTLHSSPSWDPASGPSLLHTREESLHTRTCTGSGKGEERSRQVRSSRNTAPAESPHRSSRSLGLISPEETHCDINHLMRTGCPRGGGAEGPRSMREAVALWERAEAPAEAQTLNEEGHSEKCSRGPRVLSRNPWVCGEREVLR